MGAGFVLMIFALAAYYGRHLIGRFQATVLLEAFTLVRTGSLRSQRDWRPFGPLWRSCYWSAAYGAVVSYLNRVGLPARDPFDCSLVNR